MYNESSIQRSNQIQNNNNRQQLMREPHSPTKKRYVNKANRKNQAVFGITLIMVQIAISVIYGVVGKISIQTINMASVLTAIFLAILVVVGFGLHFGYMKHLVWSSLGFSLIITCLSIQVYPLANALWGKLKLHQTADSFSNHNFTLSLASMDSINYQNNTITAAIKCALSTIVAFGSLIGRVGPLECLLLSLIGIVGYELNRSIVGGIGQDLFGSFTIFAFGGFMGLVSGIIMRMRERKKRINTYKNERLQGTHQTVVHSLFGNIAIFILLPFLAYQGDQSMQGTSFQRYIGPLAVVLSMGTAIVTSIIVSLLIHGDRAISIRLKDVLNAQIAGGIISGAASYYVTTPFLGLIAGAVAGISQYIFDNVLQRKIYRKWGVISTYSFSLFCFQSFLGSIFAMAYSWRVANGNTNSFIFPPNMQSKGQEILIYFISSGIGLGCGLLVGVLCLLFNGYKKDQFFHDQTVFLPNDGIAYQLAKGAGQNGQQNPSDNRFPTHSSDSPPHLINSNQPSSEPLPNFLDDAQFYNSSQQNMDDSFGFVDMMSAVIQ